MWHCLCHWAVQAFSTVTDGAVNLKTMVKNITAKMSWTVPASIYTDLVWVMWDDLTFGFFYNTLDQLYTVCVVSVPHTKPNTTSTHQAGPRVKWLRSPSLVRFTTYERPWDTFLHFLNTAHDRELPLLGDVISIIPTGLGDALCLTVSVKLSTHSG